MKRLFSGRKIIFIVIAAAVFLYNSFNISCPVRYALGIPCPTCGMSRALFSLARLDFRGYFVYNPMALPLAAVLFLNLYQNDNVRFNKIKITATILTAVIVFIVYLYRLRYNLIP